MEVKISVVRRKKIRFIFFDDLPNGFFASSMLGYQIFVMQENTGNKVFHIDKNKEVLERKMAQKKHNTDIPS